MLFNLGLQTQSGWLKISACKKGALVLVDFALKQLLTGCFWNSENYKYFYVQIFYSCLRMHILHDRIFFLIAYNSSSEQERNHCAFTYFLPPPSKQMGLWRLLFYSKQKSCSRVRLISRLAVFSLQNILGELVQIEWFANVSKAKKIPIRARQPCQISPDLLQSPAWQGTFAT